MTELITQATLFYGNIANRGHADRSNEPDPIRRVKEGLESGRWVADSALELLEGNQLRVLEVGCSWGPLVFSLAASPRVADVTGVDIEKEAIDFGTAIAKSTLVSREQAYKCHFVQSPAEHLNFQDDHFDLITCHTVIEHVENVEAAFDEMLRVLKPGGVLHVEAPNYLWPYEPHLHVWMLPLGPKWLARIRARLRNQDPDFVNHLQFVHPFLIERILQSRGASYQNIYLDKLAAILLRGDYRRIIGLRRWVPMLRILHTLQLTRLIYFLSSRLGIYTSIMYRVTKKR